MLRTAFAFLASPLVGVIAGGIAMSFAVEEPAAMFSLACAAFGSLFALAATLIVGIPAAYVLRRWGRPLFPWLLVPAICTALAVVVGLQCIFAAGGCTAPPLHNLVFALVSAVVTALLIGKLASRENAL